MALTMTDDDEAGHRLVVDTVRLDAVPEFLLEAAEAFAAELDATRARVAELEAKRAHETQHLLNCCAERDKALAAREAECVELRAFAAFGSWVFENFWHDGEPGDIEAYDAQEKAAEFGLLGRTSEVDAGATHAEGCDYSPDAPPTECCCFTPTRRPLDVARHAGAGREGRSGRMSGYDKTWPCHIIEDRYGGTYSGGAWVAVSPAIGSRLLDVEQVIDGDDFAASNFPNMIDEWADEGTFVAVGDTPGEALAALAVKLGRK